MGEATVSPKAMEDAMVKALSAFFPTLGTTGNQAVEFYNKFHHAADDHDSDFVKKYDEDLNSTLIFAGLFSAVTSAFIVDVQSKLEPDFEEMNHTLLKIVASAALGNIPTGADAALPEWKGPDSTIVRVQTILYSSLLTTLLSAFIAMLGKQWLNRYALVDRGSAVDRGRQRKHKMDGMKTWHFDLIMECLPLMLQAALFLLGYALSNYLFFINKTVASLVVGFTTFGVLFYCLVVSAATFSYNCPFQTPLSLVLRFLIRFDSEHRRYLKRIRRWFGRTFSLKTKKGPRPMSGGLYGLGRSGTFDGNTLSDHIELPVAGTPKQPSPIFDQETRRFWDDHVVDSNCIAWMFETPMDVDLVMVIARFIPEITWHAGIRSIPLEGLYGALLGCFDFSSAHGALKPALRDHAHFIGKALVHVTIQHKCIGNESDKTVFESVWGRHLFPGIRHYEGDSDLEATISIFDKIFGDYEPVSWQNFSFTITHHAWMGHILLYRAWDVFRKGAPLPSDIKEFILHSLRLDPPPPGPIVADCLFIIGLVLGINLHVDDLLVADKSLEVNPQIHRIYEKLTETFRNPSPTFDEIDRALESMRFIAPLPENDVAQKSYGLFHVVMQAPISLAYSREKKWEASRLAMHGAYKWDKFLPWVEDPRDIVTFLGHHLDLALRDGQNQDEPLQNAFRALAYASGPDTIQVLKRFDPTEPSFVRGMCYVFRDNKPFQLRKAALFFLPLIGDRWFNTAHPIMEPDQMRSLCVDWASTVDAIEHTDDVQKATLTVLFGMINSPHWRPHVVTGKWALFGCFGSGIPADSEPLRRCVNNPELMDALVKLENPGVMVHWLRMLWLRYTELIPQVQEQLETVTKEIARGGRKPELDACLSVINSELREVKDSLTQYDTRSTDPAATTLRTKIDNLRQARATLVALKGDSP